MAKTSTRQRRSSAPHPERGNEVTVDDVIGRLLDLFSYLGLDASSLSTRFANSKAQTRVSKETYPRASVIGEVLSAWHQDVEYLDQFGNPAQIKMRGRRRSFQLLAKKTVPDVDPRQLLRELRRIGAVELDRKGNISVLARSVPVYEDKTLAIKHTLASLESFITTLRHNLNSTVSNSEQLFHRVAWNGEFDLSQVPALKIRTKRQGQSFLEACDNWMSRRALSVSKSGRRRKTAQVSIGVYLSIDQ